MSSSLLAAVTLAVTAQASIFSSRRLSATPKWFSGMPIQKVTRDTELLSVRGGAAPSAKRAVVEPVEAPEVVEVQDLYLPGLLDAVITRTNKVRRIENR
jgi:hypothetical protein